MGTMRNLLSQEPMTFNELLDLFKAYVATIGGPIYKSHDMLREEIDLGKNVALGHILGVADDAEAMAKRLCHIRAARNSGSDVTITLTRNDADRLEDALGEIDRMFSHAATVFDLLHDRASSNKGNEDVESMAIMSLAHRALSGADEREAAKLRLFTRKLREARQYQHIEQEEAV